MPAFERGPGGRGVAGEPSELTTLRGPPEERRRVDAVRVRRVGHACACARADRQVRTTHCPRVRPRPAAPRVRRRSRCLHRPRRRDHEARNGCRRPALAWSPSAPAAGGGGTAGSSGRRPRRADGTRCPRGAVGRGGEGRDAARRSCPTAEGRPTFGCGAGPRVPAEGPELGAPESRQPPNRLLERRRHRDLDRLGGDGVEVPRRQQGSQRKRARCGRAGPPAA